MKKRIPVRIIRENKKRLLEKDGEKYISVDDLIKSLGAVDARPKKQKNKVEDLDDLIDDMGLDDSPEEIKMLDRALQNVPDSSEVVPLSPEIMALINKAGGDVDPEVDQMLAALDKSDADRAAKEKAAAEKAARDKAEKAAKEKAEKARQAAIKLLVDNPQEPVQLSVEDPSNILDAIRKWDPFPGLLPEDAPPEAKKMRTESLQRLMSTLKLIFENEVRKQVERVDKRLADYYGPKTFDLWVKNGRKLYNHYISLDGREDEVFSSRADIKKSWNRKEKRPEYFTYIRAGRLSFMQSFGLAPLIFFGLRRNYSIVRGDRFKPKDISSTANYAGSIKYSPALTALVSYNYFQAAYPDMALKESLISNFNKESDKHFIGRTQQVGKDGYIQRRRGPSTTRSHNPKEWKPEGKWDTKRPATLTPITFEELEQTMADWRSNFEKFSSMEYERPAMGYRESDEMASAANARRISKGFKDPREPYEPPEVKAKKKAADRNSDPGSVDIGGMFKYYMSIIDKADEITGGAIKRNVYMGDESFKGSEPKAGPPRIQERLVRIIKEEIYNVLKEQNNT